MKLFLIHNYFNLEVQEKKLNYNQKYINDEQFFYSNGLIMNKVCMLFKKEDAYFSTSVERMNMGPTIKIFFM